MIACFCQAHYSIFGFVPWFRPTLLSKSTRSSNSKHGRIFNICLLHFTSSRFIDSITQQQSNRFPSITSEGQTSSVAHLIIVVAHYRWELHTLDSSTLCIHRFSKEPLQTEIQTFKHLASSVCIELYPNWFHVSLMTRMYSETNELVLCLLFVGSDLHVCHISPLYPSLSAQHAAQ